MPSVDDRIVRIEFDNASFERKINDTLHSLGQLDAALKLEGATKGLAGIEQAAKGSGGSLATIAQGVDHIASRFSALGAVAFSVIQKITSGALGMAKQLGGDILEPIISGGKRRALNIEQARFMFQGLGVDVNKSMESARKAVLGTAYGLDEAAKTAAQLSASGIQAGDDMTNTLRGIAGISAMTNSSFSEMADVFTSAAGQGKISGYTLERISYRGLNAAAAFAKQTGKTEAEVRKMASEGKISFKDFADAMDKAFGAHAQEANKTYTGSLANLHAAMSRLGAAVIGPQLEQDRDLFNAITPQVDKLKEALTPLIDMFTFITRLSIDKTIKAISGISFENLKKAGPNIAKGFWNLYLILQRIQAIAGKAFRDIFPRSTVSVLVNMSKAFLDFTNRLKVGGQLAAQLRSIFRGFFSILSIGWTVIKEGIKFIGQIVSALLGLSGGSIMAGLASIGDFFTNLQNSLVKGKGIHDFFAGMMDIVKAGLPYIQRVKDAIIDLFGGFDKAQAKTVETLTGRVSDRFEHLKKLMDRLSTIWQPLKTGFDRIKDILTAIWDYISGFFTQLGKNIAEVMGKGSFSDALDAFNTLFLGGITTLLALFFKKGIKVDLTGGLMGQISGTFNQLTGVLKSMQTQIKADALQKIAIAIGILTASVLVLSLIDSAALTKALTAMAVGFTQLMTSFAIIDKMASGPKGAVNFDLIAGGMIALATALLILSGAVAAMGKLDWGELARGLTGITGVLVILSVAIIPLSRQKGGMIAAGIGLTAIGIGLNIVAAAVKIFASMSWGEMAKGLVGVGAALVIVGAAVQLFPTNMAITGAGLILVAVGLNILAGAVALFGTMDWGTLGKGLLAMAGALVVIGLAMQLMPASLPITGAGLILVGIGLNAVAGALKLMGGMKWSEIGRGLAAMAGALLILAVATNAMTGAIGGAIAIGIVAVSLTILAEALKAFSSLSWGDLIHGLVAIAAALAVLAVAALLMEPAIPAMLAMGAALLLIGASFALVGVGVMLVAKGFETLAKSGEAGAKAIVGILRQIGGAIPALVNGFAEGVLEFIKTLSKGLPLIVATIGELIGLLATELIRVIPKLAILIAKLIDALIQLIRDKAPDLIQLGLDLLLDLIQGITDNIQEIVTSVVDLLTAFAQAVSDNADLIVAAGLLILTTVSNIITSFLNSLATHVNEIVTAGANFIISLITGISNNYYRIVNAGSQIIIKFINGISNNLNQIINAATNLVITFITSLGNNAWRIVNAGAAAVLKFINGLTNNLKAIAGAATNLVVTFVTELGNNALKVVNAGEAALKKFLEGLAKKIPEIARDCLTFITNVLEGIRHAIDDNAPQIAEAGRHLAGAIINGMTGGIAEKAGSIADSLKGAVGGAVHKTKSFLKVVGDPYSIVFMGIGEAMANGMSMALDADTSVEDSSAGVVERATDIFKNSLTAITSSLGDMTEFNPTITPVLDLTQVAADAALISDYIQQSPILPASFSVAQANTIAATTTPAGTDLTGTTASAGVTFEQNIYAPEQLSTSDIYKQTRNQITLAKEELSIP
jgi:tape measure domain-containing protein